MLTIDSYPQIKVYGEPAGKEKGLFGRELVNVYMEVPQSWPIPDAYTARLMREGSPEVHRLHLRDRCAVRKGKLVADDAMKVSRRVERFYYRVQEMFWNKYFEKGLILARDILIALPPQGLINRMCTRVRVLILWTMPHRASEADSEEMELGIHEYWKTAFYPHEPDNMDAYDVLEILQTDAFENPQSFGRLPVVPHLVVDNYNSFPFFNDFESIRKMISWMVDDVDAE